MMWRGAGTAPLFFAQPRMAKMAGKYVMFYHSKEVKCGLEHTLNSVRLHLGSQNTILKFVLQCQMQLHCGKLGGCRLAMFGGLCRSSGFVLREIEHLKLGLRTKSLFVTEMSSFELDFNTAPTFFRPRVVKQSGLSESSARSPPYPDPTTN